MPAARASFIVTLTLTAAPVLADTRLHILHLNDLHSRIEPINAYDSTCPPEEDAKGECFGGVARLKTAIDGLRADLATRGEPSILVVAGDVFQGSLFYTQYKGAAEAEFLNVLGVDAMGLGNHEFDDGPAGLAGFLDLVTFPVIAGNIDVSADERLAGRVPPFTVLDADGGKVGIVAAVTTNTVDIASPGPTVAFEDEIAALTRDVAALTAQGVDRIVAVTHVGYRLDQRIAAEVPGLDAVVGGHSNTNLSASDPERAGAYPTLVTGPDGSFVPVVQAYAYGKYLGHLTLDFNDAGRVTYAGGDTILVDASFAPDASVAARVAELAIPLEEIRARVVAETTAPIDGSRETCRAMECQMGTLVAEAMLDRVRGQGVTIAITNGGGLRASIDAGPVTMGEVLGVLPFQNTLSTFQTTGADLVAALEHGVAAVADGSGRFPQVAGMRFAFDAEAAEAPRVSGVEVLLGGDAWAPIDVSATYDVVTNNFVRGGGDGYAMFRTAANAYDFGPDLADVLAEYLAKTRSYTPYTDGRITVK